MAVYIPKERLGSGRPPERRRPRPSQSITVGMMAAAFEKAKEKAEEKRNEKYEANAEVQRWRTRTSEEKMRDAIDRMVPTAKEVVSMRTGQEATDEQGRKFAEGLAYKVDAQKEEKK